MALTETIIWTACPNGFSATANLLQLSVHVAPRLSAGDTADHFLDEWPDLFTWPASVPLSASSFTVQLDSGPGTTVQTHAATVVSAAPDPTVWAAIFGQAPHGALVQERAPTDQYAAVPVISYPAANIAGLLEDVYGSAANNSPDEHPLVSDLLGEIGQIGYTGPEWTRTYEKLRAAMVAERRANPQGGPHAKRYNAFAAGYAHKSSPVDFAALREFHEPRTSTDADGTVPLPTTPAIDFHKAVALAGHHPRLMRALGLVFDLTLIADLSSFSRVRVIPGVQLGNGATYAGQTPWTRCAFNLRFRVFEPTPLDTGVMANRHLRIGDTTRFAVLEVDPDGGGLKVAHTADNLKLANRNSTEDTPDSQSLPSLREAGFQVVQLQRAASFVQTIDRASALEAGDDVYAEDLTRGYVLDVYDASRQRWYSTSARTGSYHFPAGSPADLPFTDEAPVASAPTSSANPADAKEFRLQEALVRWSGWSLAAPRPGLPIGSDDNVAPPDPSTPWGVDVQAVPAPGSLPRLRFGTSYSLRMRAVDLAGNAPPLAEAIGPGDQLGRATGLLPYLRFDPVVSPDVLIRQAPVPGESGGVIVIRGNYAELDPRDVPGTSDRFIAPPRAEQMMAETHGQFDDASGRPDPASYGLIGSRESGTYGGATPDTTTAVPYLPDPLATRAALRVLDGAIAGWYWQPFALSRWPGYRPFELRLMDGGASQSLAASTSDPQRIDVGLTKADIVRIRLSSAMDAGDPRVVDFGIHEWASRRGDFPGATFATDAADGKNWLISPFRTLTLIFAVRQPLLEPVFIAIDASRKIGDTFAFLRGVLIKSGKSTGRLDLEAHWFEPVDGGPGTAAPLDVTHGRSVRAHATELELYPGDEQDFNGRHEFHDTKHRNVEYWLVATSSFVEHFLETTTIPSPAIGVPVSLDPRGLQPERTVVRKGTAVLVAGVDYSTDDVAGTILFLKHPGADVDVQFLPPVSRATPDAGHRIVNVRSSARPLSPDIAYVVPITGWQPISYAGTTSIESVRDRAGIRVYLNRPWWSSGDGERLGVVTTPAAELASPPDVPLTLRSYVTQWGHDPVFSGPDLASELPNLSSFPGSTAEGTSLSLAERAGLLVNVAGHDVTYDAVQDLWYCDIEIDAGQAYMPFVRLALARYQPDSLLNAALSRVVLADFLQLGPGRTATVVMKNPQLIDSLSVTGPSYFTASGKAGPGVATVTIEQRDPSIADELLGWRPVGDPIPLTGALLNGQALWIKREIPVPGSGRHRLVIEQYEQIQADSRGSISFAGPPFGLRLIHQDVIPLTPPPPT